MLPSCEIVISELRLLNYFSGMPVEAKNSGWFVHLKIQNHKLEIHIFPTPLFYQAHFSPPLFSTPAPFTFLFHCFPHSSQPHTIMYSTSEKREDEPHFF